MFYDIIQIVGGIIISVGYLPQIIQILKTRSVQDLNLNTYAMIFLGICLMEIYAINLVLSGRAMPFDHEYSGLTIKWGGYTTNTIFPLVGG